MKHESGPYFRKPLLPVGEHIAPQGKLNATEDWCRERAAKFNKLRREGYRFPICWGHQQSAIPEPATEDPRDDAVFMASLDEANGRKARWNAGYIEALEYSPADKTLYMTGTAPPGYEVDRDTQDLVNSKDHTRIGEVSAGIATWKDGKGRIHPDVIIHAALTPLPVWANQPGFEEVSANNSAATTLASSTNNLYYLSTSTVSSGALNMATDTEKDKKPKNETKSPPPPDVTDELDDLEEEVEDPPAPVVPPTPLEPAEGPNGDQDYQDVVSMLSRMGLALPPDTQKKDFFKLIRASLYAYESTGMKFCKPEEEEGATGTGENNAQPGAGGLGGNMSGDLPQAESPPILMSTATIKDPMLRGLALDREVSMRKEVAALWEKAKQFGCPVSIADRESQKASTLMLSLNTATGKPVTPSSVRTARLVNEILLTMSGADDGSSATSLLKTLSTDTTEVKNPAESAPERGKVDPEVKAALRSGADQVTAEKNGSSKNSKNGDGK